MLMEDRGNIRLAMGSFSKICACFDKIFLMLGPLGLYFDMNSVEELPFLVFFLRTSLRGKREVSLKFLLMIRGSCPQEAK